MCHGQLAQLRDALADFEKAGAKLLVVDPHEEWSARHFLKDLGLEGKDVQVPLLLDPTHTVSATYGVAFQMRVHTELSNRPATFIIDREGKIRYVRRAEAFGDRPTPKQIIAELEKLP